MDGVAPHLPHTHPAGEVLYIHSASDAAIAFSRGATPCAKSGVGWAGRRADPLEPGGSIVGRTKRRGFKATVLSCANGAMTDRLSQCKKLEHGLPGLNLGIKSAGPRARRRLQVLLEVAGTENVSILAVKVLAVKRFGC